MSGARETAQALVLSVQSWSNSSQIVRLLTEAHGSISVIARGSRRMTSDFRYGPLDVMQWGSACLEKQSDGFRLVGFEAVGSFARLAAHHERLLAAFDVIEILRDGTRAVSQPGLLRLALETLAAFEHGEVTTLEAVLLRFELQFLILSGRAPHLDACVHCGREAPAPKPARLDPLQGGLICRTCLRGSADRLVPLSPAARAALHALSRSADPREAAAMLADARVRASLIPLLRMLVGLSLDHPLPVLALSRT